MPGTSCGTFIDDALTTLKTKILSVKGETVHERVLVGTPNETAVLKRFTLPDVNQLVFAAIDNDTGDAVALENFKFALTEEGLATAVAGASLNLGTAIPGGAGNGMPVWIAYTDTADLIHLYPAGISFVVLDVWEYPA